MAGIVKSTKRRLIVNKSIKEIDIPTTTLDTDLFLSDLTSVGSSISAGTITPEMNALPTIVKNEASTVLVVGAWKVGSIYGMNGDNKSVEEFVFTRNSGAVRLDFQGQLTSTTNVIRADFDPSTKRLKGYLFEKSSTNFLADSGITGGINGFPTRSPFGLVWVDTNFNMGSLVSKGIELQRNDSGTTYAYKNYALEPNKQYVFSVFVKKSDSSPPQEGDFRVVIGQITVPMTIEANYGNGVYRVYGVVDSNLATTVNCGLNKQPTFTPQSIVATGFQLEEGVYPTSYIPTDTGSATRLSDRMAAMRNIITSDTLIHLVTDIGEWYFGGGARNNISPNRNLFQSRFMSDIELYVDPTKGTMNIFPGIRTNRVKVVVKANNTFGFQSGSNSKKISVVSGQSYNLSFNIRGNINFLNYGYLMRLDGTNQGLPQTPLAINENTFTRVNIPFNASFTSNSAYILIAVRDYATDVWYEIEEISLTKGPENKAWTPCPEDIVYNSTGGVLEVSPEKSVAVKSISLIQKVLNQGEI